MKWANTPAPARLLGWCCLGTAVFGLLIARFASGNPGRFSAIFWYLLSAYDQHGNLLLLAIVVAAFFLQRLVPLDLSAASTAVRPWTVAAVALPVLLAASYFVYHAHPLSLDESSPLFQARAFAAGELSGRFPPDLLDQLIPPVFQGMFFVVSRSSGEVASSYWPGFALLMTPFAWAGVPWAANPVIASLSLPVVHRLARRASGSAAAGGWAMLLLLATPAFVVTSISFYPLPAHLLFNALYALLLIEPTPRRALCAGLLGGFALALHNPVPHLLFAVPFALWLVSSRARLGALVALAIGYLPLTLLLVFGWKQHLVALAASASPGYDAVAGFASTVTGQVNELFTFPGWRVLLARVAGLSKMWTWGAAGLLVLAAWGFRDLRARPAAKLLAAALALTFFAYFVVRFDQGHGWGYRYVYPAWFVLPVLASFALAGPAGEAPGLRTMAGWALVLSLVLANGLRLIQADAFIGRHIAYVPPLAAAPEPGTAEMLFISPSAGPYALDLVQNDPFLRGARTTLLFSSSEATAQFMARRHPGYRRSAQGDWGELWTGPR